MQNPRSIQWSQLFRLPEQAGLPLQGRLRLAIVQALLDGRLAPGAALPSSRELARLLGLSRNTVTSAYLQLIDEDFLESRPRSGVFVARDARPPMVSGAGPNAGAAAGGDAPTTGPRWRERVLRSLADRPTLAKPDHWRRYNALRLLGGALLGQKRYAAAEPLLLQGYEGMKQRSVNIPIEGKVRLTEALERLVQLYDSWGQKDKADAWRKKLPPELVLPPKQEPSP